MSLQGQVEQVESRQEPKKHHLCHRSGPLIQILNSLALPMISGSPGKQNPPLEFALASMYACRLPTSTKIEDCLLHEETLLIGASGETAKLIPHLSYLLSVINPWKYKTSTQLAIIIQVQDYLILMLLNNPGSRILYMHLQL